MISHDLLAKLHCPYCGAAFALERQTPAGDANIRYGVIRCACYRYPIIDGIAILRQRSGPADSFDQGVAYLDAGDLAGALHYACYCASPFPPRQSRLQRTLESLRFRDRNTRSRRLAEGLTFRQALALCRPGGYANYLFYRHANNSFLAAIPLLLLLKDLQGQSPTAPTRVLDLNCGVGHASFLIRRLFPNTSVILTDHDFLNLYFARNYFVPDAPCICMDAELPLPFADDYLDSVLCMDGLHYVRSKRALLQELDRSVAKTGIWLFPHLHNARGSNISPGVPLGPADYERCFDFIPSRLCIEADIFRAFMGHQTLDLTEQPSLERLDRAPVLSLVASRRKDLWRNHDRLADLLLQFRSGLDINPIYRRTRKGEGLHLQMAWPSTTLERECEAVKDFLPQECSIDPVLWNHLNSGALREDDAPALESLIKSFVLVPLPDNYM